MAKKVKLGTKGYIAIAVAGGVAFLYYKKWPPLMNFIATFTKPAAPTMPFPLPTTPQSLASTPPLPPVPPQLCPDGSVPDATGACPPPAQPGGGLAPLPPPADSTAAGTPPAAVPGLSTTPGPVISPGSTCPDGVTPANQQGLCPGQPGYIPAQPQFPGQMPPFPGQPPSPYGQQPPYPYPGQQPGMPGYPSPTPSPYGAPPSPYGYPPAPSPYAPSPYGYPPPNPYPYGQPTPLSPYPQTAQYPPPSFQFPSPSPFGLPVSGLNCSACMSYNKGSCSFECNGHSPSACSQCLTNCGDMNASACKSSGSRLATAYDVTSLPAGFDNPTAPTTGGLESSGNPTAPLSTGGLCPDNSMPSITGTCPQRFDPDFGTKNIAGPLNPVLDIEPTAQPFIEGGERGGEGGCPAGTRYSPCYRSCRPAGLNEPSPDSPECAGFGRPDRDRDRDRFYYGGGFDGGFGFIGSPFISPVSQYSPFPGSAILGSGICPDGVSAPDPFGNCPQGAFPELLTQPPFLSYLAPPPQQTQFLPAQPFGFGLGFPGPAPIGFGDIPTINCRPPGTGQCGFLATWQGYRDRYGAVPDGFGCGMNCAEAREDYCRKYGVGGQCQGDFPFGVDTDFFNRFSNQRFTFPGGLQNIQSRFPGGFHFPGVFDRFEDLRERHNPVFRAHTVIAGAATEEAYPAFGDGQQQQLPAGGGDRQPQPQPHPQPGPGAGGGRPDEEDHDFSRIRFHDDRDRFMPFLHPYYRLYYPEWWNYYYTLVFEGGLGYPTVNPYQLLYPGYGFGYGFGFQPQPFFGGYPQYPYGYGYGYGGYPYGYGYGYGRGFEDEDRFRDWRRFGGECDNEGSCRDLRCGSNEVWDQRFGRCHESCDHDHNFDQTAGICRRSSNFFLGERDQGFGRHDVRDQPVQGQGEPAHANPAVSGVYGYENTDVYGYSPGPWSNELGPVGPDVSLILSPPDVEPRVPTGEE